MVHPVRFDDVIFARAEGAVIPPLAFEFTVRSGARIGF
jgi:hypothetical protein